MNIIGQLSGKGAEKYAARVGIACLGASAAAVLAAVAGLIHAVRWW